MEYLEEKFLIQYIPDSYHNKLSIKFWLYSVSECGLG